MGKLIALLLLGAALIWIGGNNWKGDVSSVHWYNRTKVAPSDIPRYGKCIGGGSILMGACLLLTAVLEGLFQTNVFDWLVLGGCAAGLAVMLYGQFKYNGGLF